MGCYAVPTLAAVVHGYMRRRNTEWKKSTHHLWLSLLYVGGAVFGIVDHAWNGELFLVSDNLLLDLSLGVVITISLTVIWAVTVVLDRSSTGRPQRA